MKKLIVYILSIVATGLYASETMNFRIENDLKVIVKIGSNEITPKESCVISLPVDKSTPVRLGTYPMYQSWTYQGSMLPLKESDKPLLISAFLNAPRDVAIESCDSAIFKYY